MAKVVIGVDPHKRMNAVVVINGKGKVLARQQFANSAGGFRELKVFWRQWRPRTWAIEGCNGVGKYLAQRLVAEGETVLDVSTRRGRVGAGVRRREWPQDRRHRRVLDRVGRRCTATDLPEVRPDAMTVTLRLLSNRRSELVGLRTQAVCRIHRDLVVLLPGGASAASDWRRRPERSWLGSVPAMTSAGCDASLLADQIKDLVTHRQASRCGQRRDQSRGRGRADPTDQALRARAGQHRSNARRGRRRRSVQVAAPLRQLQRHRARPTTAAPGRAAPGEHQRQPQAEPRHPHRRGHPGPFNHIGRPRLLRPQTSRKARPRRKRCAP